MMNYFLLILAGFMIGLGLFVYFRAPDKKNASIISFILLLIVVGSSWSFSIGMFRLSTSIISAFFWAKIIYVCGILGASALLFFCRTFPERKFKVSNFYKFVYLVPIFLLLPFLFFTNLWIKGIELNNKGNLAILGPIYYFWIFWFASYMVWSFTELLLKYKKSQGLLKLQTQYIILAFYFPIVGCLVPNIILPLSKNYEFIWLGPFFITAMVSIIAYAIIRYRLMEIEMIIRRGLVFSVLFAATAFLFTAGISLLSQYLSAPFSGLLAALVVTVLFIPLKNFLETITDKVFFRKRYRFEDAVRELNYILIRSPKLEELLSNLLQHLMLVLKVKSAAAVIAGPQGVFISRFTIGFDHQSIFLERTSPLIQYLESSKDGPQNQIKILEVAELEEKIENPRTGEKERTEYQAIIEELSRFGFSLALPLFSKEELVGLLFLGEKRSRDPFSSQDLKFLDVVRCEAIFSIENALNTERLLRLDELKSEFVTVVSHQLRTPLSVARWNFELLLEEAFGKIPAKVKDVTQDTYQTLMVLNRGLNDMMSALEIEEGKVIIRPENIEINQEIVEETINGLEREIQAKKLTIKRRLSFKKTLAVDRQKIRRVFEIILDNAVRYSPVGSTITISTFWHKKGNRNEFLVSVEDEGIGVTSENRALISQKFFRGEEAKKMSPTGFGLGLFMARNYVELHGGQLWVEKKKGPGSIFWFTLPLGGVTSQQKR